jgi:hypothetical protein
MVVAPQPLYSPLSTKPLQGATVRSVDKEPTQCLTISGILIQAAGNPDRPEFIVRSIVGRFWSRAEYSCLETAADRGVFGKRGLDAAKSVRNVSKSCRQNTSAQQGYSSVLGPLRTFADGF